MIKAHRILEISAVFLFLVLLGISIYQIFPLLSEGVKQHPASAVIYVSGSAVLAYLLADFLSGMVHFLCDNFGSEHTPYFGPAFIEPFRKHHSDPKDITKHDFFETNGNTCLVILPIIGVYYFFLIQYMSVWFSLTLVLFCLFVVMTNQFHKWAHETSPSGMVRFIQNVGLVLSPKVHSLHHEPPFSSNYCITCGWLNPIFEKIQFFQNLKVILEKTFRKTH